MSVITTHVLDTSAGRPGGGIAVSLERMTDAAEWETIGEGQTDTDGRAKELLSATAAFLPGNYRLIFEIGPYFSQRNIECFFSQVTITFVVNDAEQHYHVPLLVSPFGYSTYRGS
jgi:5-hydroxyisourate hydrolase